MMARYLLWILAVAVCTTRVMSNIILLSPAKLELNTETPPHVIEPNRQTTTYVTEKEGTILRCQATGTPKPSIDWWKDGSPMATAGDQSIHLVPENGTLFLNNFSNRLEGYYQCHASNSHGVSLSQVIELRKRVFPSFANKEKPGNKRQVVRGQGIKLDCTDQPEYRPRGTYKWYQVENKENHDIDVRNSDRKEIDRNGSLYIVNAQPEDTSNSYACAIASDIPHVISIAKTPYVELNVIDQPVQQFEPTILGFTGYTTANIGDSVTLECFFSGQPTPTITWSYVPRNRQIQDGAEGRFSISRQGRKLEIKAVTNDDQGQYLCKASNALGKSPALTFLNVTSRPLFKRTPQIIVSPVGSDATFSCVAESAYVEIPASRPHWTKNGNKISNTDGKYVISNDGTQLTVRNVAKSDKMCVQCNVSNSQGYAFGEGYLVVIDPLRLVERPNRTVEIEADTPEVNLTVRVTSDACCPATFVWTFNSRDLKTSALRTFPYSYQTDHNVATLTVYTLANGSRDGGEVGEEEKEEGEEKGEEEKNRLGDYRCFVRHPAYEEVVEVVVTLKLKEKLEPAKKKAEPKEAGLNLWWIGLVGGLLVFIAAVVIICVMVHFNYPRQAYLLDKEEKKHQLNPERDILDHSFEEI